MISIYSRPFGFTSRGEAVTLYTLENSAGMSVGVLDFGCTVHSLRVTAPDGRSIDTVLGCDDVAGYENGDCYFGAFVGRYANRIKGSRFVLDGREYMLPPNEGENHLHGVLAKRLFTAAPGEGSIELSRLSPDGEEGFPGNLSIGVKYTLTEENELIIDYTAVTDAPTVLNFTNHSYFNLNGHDSGDVLGHMLRLAAARFSEGGAGTLPTGRILPVRGTPMDFTEEKTVGRDIDAPCEQLRMCGGYDHNFILDGAAGELRSAAIVRGEKSGIIMECLTTQPAVQLYTGNFVDTAGKGGVHYARRSGLCLETQHFPCSPNFPEFPSTVLRPGECFAETTVYKFI